MRKFLLYLAAFYVLGLLFSLLDVLLRKDYNMFTYYGQIALFITAAIFSLIASLKIVSMHILPVIAILAFSDGALFLALGRSGMFEVVDIPLYVASSLLWLGVALLPFLVILLFLFLAAFSAHVFFSLTFGEVFDLLSLVGGLVLFGVSISLRKTVSLLFSILLILTPYIPLPHLFKIPLIVFITAAIEIYMKVTKKSPNLWYSPGRRDP